MKKEVTRRVAQPASSIRGETSELNKHDRRDSAGKEAGYCRGGIGGRDDGGAVGARDEGGGTVGLRAGAAGGCGGGSGILTSMSMRADSILTISRFIWS
jgi:hypothetical protein